VEGRAKGQEGGEREESESLLCGGLFPQDVYESFNIFMRRKPKENNFKVSVHLGSRALPTLCLVNPPSLLTFRQC